MSKRHFLATLVLLCFCAAVLCAADFWTKKKYTEWTPQEVQKIMTSSPWAQNVEVVVGDPGRLRTGGGGGSTAGRSSTGGAGGLAGAGNQVPRQTFTIRFATALPMKQARMRAQYGETVATAPQAIQFLGSEDPFYLVGIYGSPRFVPAEPTGLAELAQLVIKGRGAIPAANVQMDRGQGGIAGVLYFFPKGQKPISLDDDNVEVSVKFPRSGDEPLHIKKTFKLKDMVFDGKLAM